MIIWKVEDTVTDITMATDPTEMGITNTLKRNHLSNE